MSKTSAAAAKALTSNYFELFGLAPAFALDLQALESAYRDIQSRIHPDRFAHAGDAERRASMQMTTQVNEAYRALGNPVLRAKHILELNGIDLAFETDTSMPEDFLTRQMEFREQLEEAKDTAALDAMLEELNAERKKIEEQIKTSIDQDKDFQSAKIFVRKLMFFDRLEGEVDEIYGALET
ncbi:MAG: Fe-S protein assembly co-chaperone HscB [Burkholderiales bacterium]